MKGSTGRTRRKKQGKKKDGLTGFFTSPVPYLVLAAILGSILFFFGNGTGGGYASDAGSPTDVRAGAGGGPSETDAPESMPAEPVLLKAADPGPVPEAALLPEEALTPEEAFSQEEAFSPEETFAAEGAPAPEGGPGTEEEEVPRADRAEEETPVPVESVTITGETDHMAQCTTLQLFAQVFPEEATNPVMLWVSDDETVARVSQDGLVTAVGSGAALISATSSNGIMTGFPITVSPDKKMMVMTVSSECTQNDKVGNDWTHKYIMDGETAHSGQSLMVRTGQTIHVVSRFMEHDQQPETGIAESSFKVSRTDLEQGFDITQEVIVTENEGNLAGNTAAFVVTYHFSAALE